MFFVVVLYLVTAAINVFHAEACRRFFVRSSPSELVPPAVLCRPFPFRAASFAALATFASTGTGTGPDAFPSAKDEDIERLSRERDYLNGLVAETAKATGEQVSAA